MARKEFTYRGKSVEELRKLSLKEFAALLPSRQRRSLSKGLSEEGKALLEDIKSSPNARTHVRSMIILPDMVGRSVKVYSGREFVALAITAEMLGHYLGEFVQTRKKVVHHAPGIGATKSSAALSVK
ncbi:30S ribosomal protein S19 [Candidatus Woesearchaeota archaeon]|nr:30S ribosomal protein S19 [Candidatus Woesearchaeota archaeon]